VLLGAEELLRSHGVDVVVVDDAKTRTMFQDWVRMNPTLWNEDIGV
jgi:creatinine deaminase